MYTRRSNRHFSRSTQGNNFCTKSGGTSYSPEDNICRAAMMFISPHEMATRTSVGQQGSREQATVSYHTSSRPTYLRELYCGNWQACDDGSHGQKPSES